MFTKLSVNGCPYFYVDKHREIRNKSKKASLLGVTNPYSFKQLHQEQQPDICVNVPGFPYRSFAAMFYTRDYQTAIRVIPGQQRGYEGKFLQFNYEHQPKE